MIDVDQGLLRGFKGIKHSEPNRTVEDEKTNVVHYKYKKKFVYPTIMVTGDLLKKKTAV